MVPHLVLDFYRVSVVNRFSPRPRDGDRSPPVPVGCGELPTDRRHPVDAVVVPVGAHAAVDAQDDPPSVDGNQRPAFLLLGGLFAQPDAVGDGSLRVDLQRAAPAIVHAVPIRVHLHVAAPVVRLLGVDGGRREEQQGGECDGKGGEETTTAADGQRRFLCMARHHAPESSSAAGNSSKEPLTHGPGSSVSSGAGKPGKGTVVRGGGCSSSAGVANAGKGAVVRDSGRSRGKRLPSSCIGVDSRQLQKRIGERERPYFRGRTK